MGQSLEEEGFLYLGKDDEEELRLPYFLKQYLMNSIPKTQRAIIPTIHPKDMPMTAPQEMYPMSLVQGIGLTVNPLSLIDIQIQLYCIIIFNFTRPGIFILFIYSLHIYIGQLQINLVSCMDIIQSVQTFIHSKQFWDWHGFVLSGMWVLVSALAILAKKYSTQVHLLLFAIVDFTTLFFAGAALYRVSSSFGSFMEWSTLKKAHVCAGSLFLVLMMLQHFGGVIAYYTKKPNPQHRGFGRILALIGRSIAAVGWILGGNQQNAIIVAVATLFTVALLGLTPSSKPSRGQQVPSSTERSKSPRAKRQ